MFLSHIDASHSPSLPLSSSLSQINKHIVRTLKKKDALLSQSCRLHKIEGCLNVKETTDSEAYGIKEAYVGARNGTKGEELG